MTSRPTGSPTQSGPSALSVGPTTIGGGRIAVSGITAYGYHGVFDHERRDGQEFIVDVVLDLDLSAAAASDDLGDTVDYGGLAAAVAADVEGEPLNLIEALAARIADTCLRLERVTSVSVTVHKPQAPMAVRVADVAVTLVRSRSAGTRSGEPSAGPAGDGEST